VGGQEVELCRCVAGVGPGDRLEHLQGAERVGCGVVEAEHEDVAGGVSRQAGVHRRDLCDGDDDALQADPGCIQGVVVVAVDDVEAIALVAAASQRPAQRRAQPRLVERSFDARLEQHAPCPRLRVEQVAVVERAPPVARDPLAVELAAVVALPAAQQPDEILGHARRVVRDRPAQRVGGCAVGLHPQR
jgi:hypothetical protein